MEGFESSAVVETEERQTVETFPYHIYSHEVLNQNHEDQIKTATIRQFPGTRLISKDDW